MTHVKHTTPSVPAEFASEENCVTDRNLLCHFPIKYALPRERYTPTFTSELRKTMHI